MHSSKKHRGIDLHIHPSLYATRGPRGGRGGTSSFMLIWVKYEYIHTLGYRLSCFDFDYDYDSSKKRYLATWGTLVRILPLS